MFENLGHNIHNDTEQKSLQKPRPFGVISATRSSTVMFSRPFWRTISVKKSASLYM